MLFPITRYVGKDLKCDFALIDCICVLICKTFLYTEGETKLSEMKIMTVIFPVNILFDSVITVSPATRCSLQ